MPTENELKYIIDCSGEAFMEISQATDEIYSIDQAYLQSGKGWNVRIRRHFGPRDRDPVYTYTYKQKVNGRIIEIETGIDERDYYDLFGASHERLRKTRYVITDGFLRWEVDWFLHPKTKNHYFSLVEVELPEGVSRPHRIPDIIKKHLLSTEPVANKTFSSRKLSSPEYAAHVYENFLEGLDDE